MRGAGLVAGALLLIACGPPVSVERVSGRTVTQELVIPFADHSVQGHPLVVEEVRPILLAHAQLVCEASRVACGRSSAHGPDAPVSR